MKLESKYLALITLIFVLGSVALTSMMGLWKTTNDKVPAKYKDGDFSGQYDPADIRGSYTFGDIYNAFGIPVEDLGRAFGVADPAEYESFQCKELETLYTSLAAEGKEVGTGSVRYFVALYKGLPIVTEEDTYLPKTAVEILKSRTELTSEQINYIEKYSVDLPKETIPAAWPDKKETSVVDNTIKGNTTFQELMDWGVLVEDIEKVINDELVDPKTIIKDYASAKGVEFSTLRVPLQELADSLGK